MKKEWQKPVLEVLDVKETMLGTGGEYTDKAFAPHTPKGSLSFES